MQHSTGQTLRSSPRTRFLPCNHCERFDVQAKLDRERQRRSGQSSGVKTWDAATVHLSDPKGAVGELGGHGDTSLSSAPRIARQA